MTWPGSEILFNGRPGNERSLHSQYTVPSVIITPLLLHSGDEGVARGAGEEAMRRTEMK